ncbi:RraA family protein [Bradyrhizobium sp. McL0615]|uniref:RraA family protein n=1 Tax=Bradyrhizobium sp. McL0615 TaxID=3415673 RepID=UPI003CEFA344
MDDAVYLKLSRPHPDMVARVSRIAVSDLYEALPADERDGAVMNSRIRPLLPGIRIAGPAVTARCAPNDNLMMHKALLLAQRGDVLVVDGGEPSGAQWGYLAAVYANKKELAGVVIDGCIRDADELVACRSPVWFKEISPSHPTKKGPGTVNVPVQCGGVRVQPGDLVCADGDGVLVIPQRLLEATIFAAEARAKEEAAAVKAIEAGQSLFEIHGLESALQVSGVKVSDSTWMEGRN